VNTWKVILATLVIFGAGVVTGGLLVGYSNHNAPNGKSPGEIQSGLIGGTKVNASKDNKVHAPLPSPLRKDFVDRLDKELKLKTGQRERIEKIIGGGQEQAKRAWQTIEPEMSGILTQTREKIRCELNSGQQDQFDELMKRPKAPAKDKSTNSPSSNSTNSVSLDLDTLACVFGIKLECLSPETESTAKQTEKKALLQHPTEPGS
jgi:hypothetical protein